MNDSAESRPLTFGELGVPGPLVRVLAADDKKTAFPIQADTLPDSLAGRDILGRGRTGSGKTLAFSIPLVTRLGSYDSFGEIAMEEFRKEIKRRKKASLEERRAALEGEYDSIIARLWEEYLYTADAQNLWFKGGANPVLLDSMKEDGTVDQATLKDAITIEGEPVSYTNDDSTRITEWLQNNWDKTIGN